VIDRYRKTKEMEPIENQTFETYVETPHQYTEARDLGRFIWKLMEQLPPVQQMIMRLKDIEGLEVERIAQITNSSPEAVRMNLSRARQKIRYAVSGEGALRATPVRCVGRKGEKNCPAGTTPY
jgi:RNA polymerase sigma-70 factor (ECF subfamily)